jgi:hypothetical protein
MKALLMISVLTGHALAGEPLVARITPDAQARLQQADPMIRLQKPAAGEVKVARPADESIIAQSTILSDGTNWTIVPNGAVLFVPEKLKTRISTQPSGGLLAWSDFLVRSRGWITTCEVSIDQATGKDSLPAERGAFWAKQDKIVVAVHQRGPISFRSAPTSNTPQS